MVWLRQCWSVEVWASERRQVDGLEIWLVSWLFLEFREVESTVAWRYR